MSSLQLKLILLFRSIPTNDIELRELLQTGKTPPTPSPHRSGGAELHRSEALLAAVRQKPGCKCDKSDDHQKNGRICKGVERLRQLLHLPRPPLPFKSIYASRSPLQRRRSLASHRVLAGDVRTARNFERDPELVSAIRFPCFITRDAR
jgi:hypothetical protein